MIVKESLDPNDSLMTSASFAFVGCMLYTLDTSAGATESDVDESNVNVKDILTSLEVSYVDLETYECRKTEKCSSELVANAPIGELARLQHLNHRVTIKWYLKCV